MPKSVLWFRRDLRLSDNEALCAAAALGEVVPLFVLDPRFLDTSGAPRLAFLFRNLRALNESMGARAFDGNPYGAWNVPQGGTNAGYEAANELRRTSTAENATVVRSARADVPQCHGRTNGRGGTGGIESQPRRD